MTDDLAKLLAIFSVLLIVIFFVSVWLFHREPLDLTTVCKQHGGIHQVITPDKTEVLCNDGTDVKR